MSTIASPSDLRLRQLLFRMGYGSEVRPTPRRTVDEISSLEG
jgi:hypothetical protein